MIKGKVNLKKFFVRRQKTVLSQEPKIIYKLLLRPKKCMCVWDYILKKVRIDR